MAFILNEKVCFYWQNAIYEFKPWKLVKNLSDDDFKYWTQKFGSKSLELLKQKDAYPYEYLNSFKIFSKEKIRDKEWFCGSLNDGTNNWW